MSNITITRTIIQIPGMQNLDVSRALTLEQVKLLAQSENPATASMDLDHTVNNGIATYTFRHKSGNKGTEYVALAMAA